MWGLAECFDKLHECKCCILTCDGLMNSAIMIIVFTFLCCWDDGLEKKRLHKPRMARQWSGHIFGGGEIEILVRKCNFLTIDPHNGYEFVLLFSVRFCFRGYNFSRKARVPRVLLRRVSGIFISPAEQYEFEFRKTHKMIFVW